MLGKIEGRRKREQYRMRWLDGIIDSIDMKVKVAQSCPTLCDPVDCSLPGSSVHGILQARILGWVAFPFSRGIFPTQRLNPGLSRCRHILSQLSHKRSSETLEWVAISFSSFPLKLEGVTVQYTQAKLYPTLCDPMDCSPPGFSVHGIL